ncbi:indole-3-glycerol-phosphate synthase [Methanosphaera sp. WGK6]|uniref:indole-3-glycerol-phosphate synthase n=1 Tax=Methanosphaera sp. WGK6 TaxID=1561964 RepID=UPI00084CA5B9|nr:indole-3-glycerol-phosphate synthase [Methanosphaera sp. WGK6]OED30518.1 indole-3-glycerol-phosphate synthase TrpC [Methanosphaera sp. WGK6]
MDVIPKIIENKKKLLNKTKNKKSLNEIKKEAIDYTSTKTNNFRFQEKLNEDKHTKLIAEYKPASPSQGNISSLKVEDVIPIYNQTKVDMISVLTEESYFKSNLQNLKKATELTNKPILRKDFVIDEYMIYEAALYNASAVLLITNITPDINNCLNICEDLGLDAIVECHSKEDIDSIIEYNPKIIGINNRNLTNLTINLETTKKLQKYVPNFMISESGVNTPEDAKLLKSYGANAVLIGTSILKNNEKKGIEDVINNLSNVLKK